MKATIQVNDKREAEAVRVGLEDPAVRAFVVIMGVMKSLPSKRAQARVMQYVTDRLDEDQENAAQHGRVPGTSDGGQVA
jgi:hypothetical protein